MNTAAPNLPLSRFPPAPAACLAALQGGQARRTARSSKPKYQNRALTARKQRFLTAVHTGDLMRSIDGYQGQPSTRTALMARTIMVERLNVHPDVIEAQLAHEKRGPLGAAYDRAEFMEQRRHMMKAWADYLEELRLRPAAMAKRYEQPTVAANAGQKVSAGRATKRSAVLGSPAAKT